MQELLGSISRLDPGATLGLRVIACFDELILGNVNTRALLAAAAALAGCPAGVVRIGSSEPTLVSPRGEMLACTPAATPKPDRNTGYTVWLQRAGAAGPNDGLILERLSIALCAKNSAGDEHRRRGLSVVLDPAASQPLRAAAADDLGLRSGEKYRVVLAPLFAVWERHPAGPEDVIGSPFGPLHAALIAEQFDPFQASPCGIGSAHPPGALTKSLRSALTALRLSESGAAPVCADDYGGLLDALLVDEDDVPHDDVVAVARIAERTWGLETVSALITHQTVRETARALGVHHSTLQHRLATVLEELGFPATEGLGRARLAAAYLTHRVRTSRVLEAPPPAQQVQR